MDGPLLCRSAEDLTETREGPHGAPTAWLRDHGGDERDIEKGDGWAMKQVRKQLLELTQAWEDACDKLGREPVAVWLCGCVGLRLAARWNALLGGSALDVQIFQPSNPPSLPRRHRQLSSLTCSLPSCSPSSGHDMGV